MSSRILSILNERSETYEKLKAEADAAGLTVPEYLDREWEKTRPRFTEEELWERIQRLAPLFAGLDAAELVREARDERDAQMDEWLKDVGRR
jgi:hypothetical protein